MQGDHPAAQPLVLERLAQHAGRDDRLAVVGEAERARIAQLRHLGQLLAAQAAGDRRQEADRDARLGAAVSISERSTAASSMTGSVFGIAITAQNPPAAAAARSGLDVLLVLLAGGAQVHVRVHESREEVLALGVDRLGTGGGLECSGRRQLGDLTGPHEHVVWPSIPAAGSSTCAPRSSRLGGRAADGR